MAIRQILTVKDPRLRQVAKPVSRIDKKLLGLIKDLEDTLKIQKDPEGVGLAAPQVGIPSRLFVMRKGKQILTVINPEIITISGKTNDPPKKKEDGYIMEGCLSLPNYYGPVKRAWELKVRYQTPDLETIETTFVGFPAQIFQHEVDHLNGKIFVDRLLEQNRTLFELKDNEWKEVEI